VAKAVDISPILTYIYRMKEKELIIKSKNISPKQWSTLLLELNLIVQAWKPYATLELKAPGLKKVLGWGTRKYDHK
jgi:hypothetical protein|tara:strand:- start:503 stop:730 length:228 start_codon:yes stop_codon:yes gene_type:complete